MGPYERDVASCERALIAHDELRAPTLVQFVIEGVGNLEPEPVRQALRLATEANPGAALVLDETQASIRWRVGATPDLTAIDAPAFTGSSDAGAPFLLSPLTAHGGPSCGVLLIRGTSKVYVVFRALHAVMDGRGMLCWARDVMRCLRGEAPHGHPDTLTVDQLLRDAARPPRPTVLPNAIPAFGATDLDATPGGSRWQRVTVERPLDALASGRIAVALAHRARAHGGEGIFRINIPVDLRPHRPDVRTTANLFSCLHIDITPDASSETLPLSIVQRLYRQEPLRRLGLYASHDCASLAAFRVMTLFELAREHDTGHYTTSATLTNLGVLESAELGAPGFRATSAYFIPSAGGGCVITLTGVDGHTEAGVGLSARCAGGGQLDELAALVRAAIELTPPVAS